MQKYAHASHDFQICASVPDPSPDEAEHALRFSILRLGLLYRQAATLYMGLHLTWTNACHLCMAVHGSADSMAAVSTAMQRDCSPEVWPDKVAPPSERPAANPGLWCADTARASPGPARLPAEAVPVL